MDNWNGEWKLSPFTAAMLALLVALVIVLVAQRIGMERACANAGYAGKDELGGTTICYGVTTDGQYVVSPLHWAGGQWRVEAIR